MLTLIPYVKFYLPEWDRKHKNNTVVCHQQNTMRNSVGQMAQFIQ